MAIEGARRRRTGAGIDPGFPALKARVIARTGHHYYADKDDLLFDRLIRRFRALGLPDATAYAARLDGPEGETEWAALEAEITIGETFFFRYAEQFAALRDTILPGLLATRAQERRLRIWSAGCSTGAEPYSIAILLHELLGVALPSWDIAITGTDISADALAVAREAEYGRWALRTMPAEDRIRWFRHTPAKPGATREGGYRLRPEFRAMVRFERQNLLGLTDGTVPETVSGFDLILCRNVLIYFSAETVFRIVRGFGDRLAPGGWLLIGHAEPNPAFAGWLSPVNLPGTVAYRRHDEPALPVEADSVAAKTPLGIRLPDLTPPAIVERPITPLAALPVADIAPAPPDAPPPESIAPVAPQPTESLLTRIRALADAGDTAQAWRALGEALAADPTDAGLRFYEGLLALGLGREPEAERAFRGALFIDRDFVMAHYQLGLFLNARGRPRPARRALDNALRLAQGMPPQAVLPEGDGVTAGEMVGVIRLARGDAA